MCGKLWIRIGNRVDKWKIRQAVHFMGWFWWSCACVGVYDMILEREMKTGAGI